MSRAPWNRGDASVYFIAEAGVNHDGEVEEAVKLVRAAARAGADAVKFQTWKPGELTGRFTGKAAYMDTTTPPDESRYELSARLALPYEAFTRLKGECERAGIDFMSTPDGFESLDFLVDDLNMDVIKVGSTEVNHLALLRAIGAKRRPVILSTGLSSLSEVAAAAEAVREGGAEEICVLQCTSQYPAPDADINLRAMAAMGDALKAPFGLSDHSTGAPAVIAAAAMGARVIEKHFTLDRSRAGPDHQASLTADELGEVIADLRRVESMLGDGLKRVRRSEAANHDAVRRSVVAARAISAGEILTADMLVCKRPGWGIEPDLLEAICGFAPARDLREDEPIRWEDLRR